MTNPELDDEMLMAFVDGELEPGSAEAVARAVDAEPALARRADQFRASRQAAREVFGRVLSQPVPEHLLRAIYREDDTAGKVVPFRPRETFGARAALALAACLALAAGLGGGLWLGALNGTAGGGGLIRGAETLTARLASQPSGPETAVEIEGAPSRLAILGSYAVSGGVCRTFQLSSSDGALRGIGCDRGSGFGIDVVVAGAGAPPQGFSPASDRAASSLDAYLDALEAQGPLSAEEEASFLRP